MREISSKYEQAWFFIFCFRYKLNGTCFVYARQLANKVHVINCIQSLVLSVTIVCTEIIKII